MTSYRDDVKILKLQQFRGIKVNRIVMFLVKVIAQSQPIMIKLYNAIIKEITKTFHLNFCLIFFPPRII